LSAIHLHNVALAKLARACAVNPDELEFKPKISSEAKDRAARRVVDLARPPAKLTQQ